MMEVWSATIDGGEWKAKVVREGEAGRLIVERASDGLVILDQPVTLSYGAIFGPDVDDVAVWEDMALAAVDNS